MMLGGRVNRFEFWCRFGSVVDVLPLQTQLRSGAFIERDNALFGESIHVFDCHRKA